MIYRNSNVHYLPQLPFKECLKPDEACTKRNLLLLSNNTCGEQSITRRVYAIMKIIEITLLSNLTACWNI